MLWRIRLYLDPTVRNAKKDFRCRTRRNFGIGIDKKSPFQIALVACIRHAVAPTARAGADIAAAAAAVTWRGTVALGLGKQLAGAGTAAHFRAAAALAAADRSVIAHKGVARAMRNAALLSGAGVVRSVGSKAGQQHQGCNQSIKHVRGAIG